MQVLSIGETVEEVSDSGFLATSPTLRTQLLVDDSMLQVSTVAVCSGLMKGSTVLFIFTVLANALCVVCCSQHASVSSSSWQLLRLATTLLRASRKPASGRGPGLSLGLQKLLAMLGVSAIACGGSSQPLTGQHTRSCWHALGIERCRPMLVMASEAVAPLCTVSSLWHESGWSPLIVGDKTLCQLPQWRLTRFTCCRFTRKASGTSRLGAR